MSDLRENHPFNDFTPALAERAKDLARDRGHTNVDAIIVCSDGVTHGLEVPVWRFYLADAKLEADSAELCGELERLYGASQHIQAQRERP